MKDRDYLGLFLGMGITLMVIVYAEHHHYADWEWNTSDSTQLGHVVRAVGTVKFLNPDGETGYRLETGHPILVPIHPGDQIQTGEDSEAEVLFFGGSTLQLGTSSLLRLEDRGSDVSIRLLLGKAEWKFSSGQQDLKTFSFEKADGTVVAIPSGKTLVLTLSAINRLDDAIEARVMNSTAQAEFENSDSPMIVPPLSESGRAPALDWQKSQFSRIVDPKVKGPANDSYVDVDANELAAFKWDKIERKSGMDPVVAYQVVVRPAFSYDVEEDVRKRQEMRTRQGHLRIEHVGGGGVFLWSVHAVTAKGKRGPASTPRWLEIKFPKQLVAPSLLKPKVD